MIFDKLKSEAVKHDWDLGFILDTDNNPFTDKNWSIKYVKHSFHDRWFADPFILDVTDSEIIVLCEEFMYSTKKGRLAKLNINKHTFEIAAFKIILELPTHLSYPIYFRDDEYIYIYPENSSSGKLIMYRYNTMDDSVTRHCVVADFPLTDAVSVKIGAYFYIFSTFSTENHGNGNKLHVLKSSSFDGKYSEFQTIEFQDNTARGAGDFFYDGDKLVRPAQNCNDGYGKGIVFQEVKLVDGSFVVTEICRNDPPPKYVGMHTYNKFKNMVVLDFYFLRHPFLNRCFWLIRNLIYRK